MGAYICVDCGEYGHFYIRIGDLYIVYCRECIREYIIPLDGCSSIDVRVVCGCGKS